MSRRRINLASRPLGNQLLPGTLLALLLVAAVGATSYNLVSYIRHARAAEEFAGRVAETEEEIADLRERRSRYLRDLDQERVPSLAVKVEAANTLLRQRNFSWTHLFNELEGLQPYGIQLERIQPTVQPGGGITLRILGEAKTADDMYEYIDRLEVARAFSRVYPQSEGQTDRRTTRFLLQMSYHPGDRVPAHAGPADSPEGGGAVKETPPGPEVPAAADAGGASGGRA